ncbi:hypothetical protein [Aeromonas hydrophila]|uniref:hypothetical protein n=1 Tax=Aeromonas hydrophila TaxID=644 RepID=UPI003D2135D7
MSTSLRLFINVFNPKRAMLLIGILSAIFSLTSFLTPNLFTDIMNPESLDKVNVKKALLFASVSVFAFTLVYLQSGDAFSSISKKTSLTDYDMNQLSKMVRIQALALQEMREKVNSYKSEPTLSDDDKKELINNITDSTQQEVIEAIFKQQVKDLKDSIEKNSDYEKLKLSVDQIKVRLYREISDLRLRSNVNLLIGMLITAVGLYLLWSTVSMIDTSSSLKTLAYEGAESNSQFFKNLILPLVPRIMLVIFIEIFAYFFLRLYKNGLSEIKYFQNELTNVESKLVALELSYLSENNETMASVILSLVKTERNFVLENGQTTVELEKAKSESEMMKSIVNAVPNLFKK